MKRKKRVDHSGSFREQVREAILAVYYSRPMSWINQVMFLQMRPTFDKRTGLKMLDGASAHAFLMENWDNRDIVRGQFLIHQSLWLDQLGIEGDIVELGVYTGDSAELFRRISKRRLHLFDTFAGFDPRDSALYAAADCLKDTSLEHVRSRVGTENVFYYPGYFPETLAGYAPGRIALLHIDLDLYEPIKAALQAFYPHLEPGGLIIVHDFNNPGSWDDGAQRAVREFLEQQPLASVPIPDLWGSIVLVKPLPRTLAVRTGSVRILQVAGADPIPAASQIPPPLGARCAPRAR